MTGIALLVLVTILTFAFNVVRAPGRRDNAPSQTWSSATIVIDA
jgi:hypothetical protein